MKLINKIGILFNRISLEGKNNEWAHKVSVISKELIELLYEAKKRKIPTVFWHKEVPPHFETFMEVSKLFDYIFLTDQESVERYKKGWGMIV
ncbi:MAG: hypothetical protein R3A45_11625 [Bdellovibrionota bacterium]